MNQALNKTKVPAAPTWIPKFTELHFPAKPLSILANSLQKDFFQKFNKHYDLNLDLQIQEYSLNDIKKKGLWEEIDPNTVSRDVPMTMFNPIFQTAINEEVEDNLLEHLGKWSPYVSQFGLLLIELHTIPPAVAARNIGKTAATAYDATHGFSDQYIIEIEVFNKVAAEAGLFPDPAVFRKFPDSEIATVSINLLKGK